MLEQTYYQGRPEPPGACHVSHIAWLAGSAQPSVPRTSVKAEPSICWSDFEHTTNPPARLLHNASAHAEN
jgi:hypothetical protein